MVVFFIIVANALLSTWCIYNDPVINNDAVTYLSLAELLLKGQWATVFDYYSWPFYPIFIAATSKLTFLNVEAAAYLLNTLFITLLTLAFVCIVDELSQGNRQVILIAAIVILMFPSINKYRSFIVRDFGYLSFYLWSLFFIFRYCKTFNKNYLAGWLLCAAVSCLFRFEGIIFVLIAPYFLFWLVAKASPHRRLVLQLLSVALLISCTALMFWYMQDKYSALIEVANQEGRDISGLFDLFIANLNQKLGTQNADFFTYIKVVAGDFGNVLYELIRRLAVFYFLFAAYALYRGLAFTDNKVRTIWFVYLVANLALLLGYSFFNNFLVSRYTLASALTLLILVPFVIDRFTNSFPTSNSGKKAMMMIVLLLLIAISVDRFRVKHDKSYISDAGKWVAEHLGEEKKIHTNNRLIMYYMDRGADQNINRLYSSKQLVRELFTKQIRQYDYILLQAHRDNRREDELRQTLAYNFGRPIKIFRKDEKQAIYVFEHNWGEENAFK